MKRVAIAAWMAVRHAFDAVIIIGMAAWITYVAWVLGSLAWHHL